MSEQMSDPEVDYVVSSGEQMLDFLVDSYGQLAEKDKAEGAENDWGALGGVGMLADKAVETGPTTPSILLALAVRRLAKAGQSNG